MEITLDRASNLRTARQAEEAVAGSEASSFLTVREGQAVVVRVSGGADAGSRPRLNFIPGTNIGITAVDDNVNDEIDITISVQGSVTITSLTVGGGTSASRIKHGTAVLVAGVVTVPETSITANTRVFVHRQTDGGTVGASYSITRTVGVDFTITARVGAGGPQPLDTSTVGYLLIEP